MRISSKPSLLQVIDQKQQEKVKYFNHLGIMITNDVKCTDKMKSRISMAKAAFIGKKNSHQQIRCTFKKETSKVMHLEHSIIWY